MADDDTPDTVIAVAVEGDAAPPDDGGDVTQLVIVPESDSGGDSEALSVEHRLTLLETGLEEVRDKVFAAQITAETAQFTAEEAVENTEEVTEEIAPVAEEIATDVVEATELVDEEGDEIEGMELDAPDPSPRSSKAHFLFSDHPFRDRRKD